MIRLTNFWMMRAARWFDGCVNMSIFCRQNRFQTIIYFSLRTVEVGSSVNRITRIKNRCALNFNLVAAYINSVHSLVYKFTVRCCPKSHQTGLWHVSRYLGNGQTVHIHCYHGPQRHRAFGRLISPDAQEEFMSGVVHGANIEEGGIKSGAKEHSVMRPGKDH